MTPAQRRALHALARHDGTCRASDRTSARSGIVDYRPLGELMAVGLAYRHTANDLTTRFGLTDAGRKVVADAGVLG